ncbi:MAG: phytanoyl-CoA dioxygenase family protein [Pseudomonadota bacterium]
MATTRRNNVLVRVLMWPVHVLQIFTGAKSFKANPVLGSVWLNRLGLHVGRVVLAAMVARFRYFCLSAFAPARQRQAYLRDGFIVLPNFLPTRQFEALTEEVNALQGEVRQCVQGDTLTQRVLLNDKVLDAMPVCGEALEDQKLLGLLKYTSAKNTRPIFYVQNIKSNVVEAAADPQRTLHSDTFHATMKAWLFIDDVSERNGPFTYVPSSHRLTWKRLKWEYQNSIQGSELPNSYAARGSLRIDEKELEALGLPAPKAFKVPANTLVIANTNGFHRRGEATDVSSRMEIWAYSRTNPFNPLPGFGFKWFTKLSHVAIEKFLVRQDKLAERKGMKASWHRVGDNALHEMPVAEKSSPQRKLPEVA